MLHSQCQIFDGRYAVNGVSGDIEGVISLMGFGMDDGARQLGGIWDNTYSWVEVRIRGDGWASRFDPSHFLVFIPVDSFP